MVSDLLTWKVICPDSSPEAFIFPNRDGSVRDPNNYREPDRELSRYRQLPQARAWPVAREAKFSETDVSGNPESCGYPQPDQGNGEGYPGHDASRPPCNDNRCLYAGDSRGGQADDRLDARRTPQSSIEHQSPTQQIKWRRAGVLSIKTEAKLTQIDTKLQKSMENYFA